MTDKITDKDFHGVLFENFDKTKDFHSEWNGKAKIEGVDYYVNAYVKPSSKGNFFKLIFVPVKAKVQI